MSSDPVEVQMMLTLARFKEWLQNDLFHLNWWLIVLVFGIDIYLWWKYVDKSRLGEIVLFAAVTAVLILILDELGEELTLWYYPTDVFPLFPPVEAIDIACLPFMYALIYQVFKKWKGYVAAMAGLAIFSCFVFEPLFIWIGMYKTITWKIYYGLPLYFAIGIAAKAAMSLIMRTESKSAVR